MSQGRNKLKKAASAAASFPMRKENESALNSDDNSISSRSRRQYEDESETDPTLLTSANSTEMNTLLNTSNNPVFNGDNDAICE